MTFSRPRARKSALREEVLPINGLGPEGSLSPRGKSRSTIWGGRGRVQWTKHLGREPLLPFGAQRVWNLGYFWAYVRVGVPHHPPHAHLFPLEGSTGKKKKKNLQIRRADAALDRSSEEVGSWVGHIRPAARLLGASWVMAMLGRVKKAGPSAQGKKEREALGPIQAETQSSIRSSWICVALTPLDLTELWA